MINETPTPLGPAITWNSVRVLLAAHFVVVDDFFSGGDVSGGPQFDDLKVLVINALSVWRTRVIGKPGTVTEEGRIDDALG